MIADPALLALVGVAFLLGGLVKGALGLGMPVVVIALLAPTIGLQYAMTVLILPSIASNLWQGLTGGAFVALVRRLWPFLLAALCGIWAGTGILAEGDTRLLETLLGSSLATYSAFSLLTPQLPPPGRHERWMSPVMGGAGGAMFGMTGIYIVPGILYLQTLGLDRNQFVQALGISFLTISTGLGVALSGRALVEGAQIAISAGAIVPAFAGLLLGQRVRYRISEALFRTVFFVALLVFGLFMIARAQVL